jgi:organic hydroperoxide reductase OsmC/OhrA
MPCSAAASSRPSLVGRRRNSAAHPRGGARSTSSSRRTPAGLAFVSVDLRVAVRVATGQVELAERLLQTAKRHCIVTNSLNAPIRIVAAVTEEQTLPA